MGGVIKIAASDKMLKDLEELKQKMDASSITEAVRRAVAQQWLLTHELEQVESLTIRGTGKKGVKRTGVLF